MPSRRSQTKATKATKATDEREERKKRQEKFRKRTRSLFNKSKLLAKDTDASVALIVRDRAGGVQSFRSSDSLYWPPSIQDVMTTHPSGTHEFLEKRTISGCWKEVAEDESDAGMADCDADSVDEVVPTSSVILIEDEAEEDSTMSADQCLVGEDVEGGANEPATQTTAGDPLGDLDNTPLLQLKELDGRLVDAEQLDGATVDAARDSGNPSVDTGLDSGIVDDTIFGFGELDDMTVDTSEKSSHTKVDMSIDSPNIIVHKLGDNVPAAPGEVMAIDNLGTANTNPISLEYDMIDLDIQGAKGKAQQVAREGNGIEAANTLCTISQSHNPPSSGGLGNWQVVNWSMVDPKELLRTWNWVFQK